MHTKLTNTNNEYSKSHEIHNVRCRCCIYIDAFRIRLWRCTPCFHRQAVCNYYVKYDNPLVLHFVLKKWEYFFTVSAKYYFTNWFWQRFQYTSDQPTPCKVVDMIEGNNFASGRLITFVLKTSSKSNCKIAFRRNSQKFLKKIWFFLHTVYINIFEIGFKSSSFCLKKLHLQL
jgi:hypothetical protein